MMRYISTRGEAPVLGFCDVMLTGLARDGGLYVPSQWPSLTVGDLTPTLTVDSTATAILARSEVVDAARVVPGLVIVGIASFGRATYEQAENSGIGQHEESRAIINARGVTCGHGAVRSHDGFEFGQGFQAGGA